MRPDGLLQAIAWLAFLSACLLPFAAGGVFRAVWIPLSQFWLGLGLFVVVLRWPAERMRSDVGGLVSRALLPLHALFVLHLLPMPGSWLAVLSPGSFAAHFLPDPGDGRFRPLSVSPSATVEAWLYVAGLQGLFLALQAIPREKRRGALLCLLGAILVLAGEGLWQSRSARPHHLYGLISVPVPSGFETAVFGPYLNRNHFATPVAMGAGLALGLAASLLTERGGMLRLLRLPGPMARFILLGGASAFLAFACAASGSRSGVLAALVGLSIVALGTFGKRVLIGTLVLGASMVVLTGSATFERLLRLDIVTSRWNPWVDMTGVMRFFPMFGSGIGTFAAAYWPYQRHVTYEFWQYAHNDYLQWLLETGVVGLVAAGLMIRAMHRNLIFDPEVRQACIAASLAFAFQAFLDFPSHIPASAATLVCVLALSLSARPQDS